MTDNKTDDTHPWRIIVPDRIINSVGDKKKELSIILTIIYRPSVVISGQSITRNTLQLLDDHHGWTGDCSRHQGEALLRRSGLRARNGNRRLLLLHRKVLRVAGWAGRYLVNECATLFESPFLGSLLEYERRYESTTNISYCVQHTCLHSCLYGSALAW